jgi:hypothetical protein
VAWAVEAAEDSGVAAQVAGAALGWAATAEQGSAAVPGWVAAAREEAAAATAKDSVEAEAMGWVAETD